jgi:ketosteroid isomerase-like protein
MLEEDVEIERRSFDVWNKWDVEALRRMYAEDAMVETGITGFGRTFKGEDPIGRWAAEMRETWAEVRWELDRIFEADDVVVSFYRGIGIGRESGVEVVRDLTGIYRLRDGLIVSERVYLNREEALEAAGLSE